MGKTTGFLEFDRKKSKKVSEPQRLKNYNEHIIPVSDEELSKQAARCMDCGVPFCNAGVTLNNMTSGCPLHNLIPEWNHLVYLGKYEDAYERLSATSPFPEFTARVCPAPCEGACTNGLNYESVTIKDIEYKIINYAFEHNLVQPYNGPKTDYNIAVIGSGPAGLSAAKYLTSVGHNVTVFEKADRPGGLLMYGIPNMKLDKSYITRRAEVLAKSGVEFVYNTEISESNKELLDNYDAVLIATGAEQARDLPIEGRELNGVHFAMEYLTDATKSLLDQTEVTIDAKGKNVVIIGGGDTATDCVATALRQGCKSVTQLEITDKPKEERNENNPWPEYPKTLKTDYGQEEAIYINNEDPRIFNTTALKFIGKDKVEGVLIDKCDFVDRKLVFRNEQEELKADLVLIAIGFTGPKAEVFEALDTTVNKVDHNPFTLIFDTDSPSVFVAGDARRGQSLVVTALQEGKLAAKEIDIYLTGNSYIK